MEHFQGIDSLLEGWEAAEDREDATEAFRQWRAEHLRKHREFRGLKQREMGSLLDMSQALYAKFEQANNWGSRSKQISELLHVPMEMLQNQSRARAFFSRDGGLTYIKLLESTIDRWADETDRTTDRPMLPVEFIRDRLNAERRRYPDDEHPITVLEFMATPVANDLNQETKRWIEHILDLDPGSLADLAYYTEKRAARIFALREARRHFLNNVQRLLAERRWTPADLAAHGGLALSEVADRDGRLLFQPLKQSHIAGVSVAFGIDYSLLTMEHGNDMQRESAGALMELPASVRSFIAWLHSTITETSDEQPGDGAIAVTAMLPMIRAMLEQLHTDATRRPQVAEAMKGLFHAYRDETVK